MKRRNEMKKKTILAIGVIALFIGMAFIPAGTTIEMKPTVESQENTGYKFSGTAFRLFMVFQEMDIFDHSIIGLATVEGECSDYSKNLLGFIYLFHIRNEGEYATVDPWWIGKTRTYTYEDIGTGSLGGIVEAFFLPWTVEITEI
jgi:hypothetical protein